ncbi:MAG: ATP-binding protein, partial [Bacteroidales bacterium]|nr:ATP-binding protein [Bacteroidales bacterium]
SVFQKSKNSRDLKISLSASLDKNINEGKTILFLDEVQEYKEVVTKIKFWVDEGSFRYILSGSLLGVELVDLRSAPVGYLDELRMFPLDFIEYLWACGVGDEVIDYLKDCFDKTEEVMETVHDKMMEHFRRYLIVGGMPSCVNEFIESGDIRKVATIQKNIISEYKRDFTKYETKDKKLMIQSVYDLIPSELLKQNRRFNLAEIKKGLKFERVEDSFLWLKAAGVAICVYNATEPRIALNQNMKSSLVKLYMSDVGLLTDIYGPTMKLGILSDNKSVNCGGIYENAVVQELLSHGFDLYYYNSKRLGELDLVIEYMGGILPIEVKSGKDYYVHSALDNCLSNEEFAIEKALVFTNYNVSVKGKTIYLPIYMSMFLTNDIELPVLNVTI